MAKRVKKVKKIDEAKWEPRNEWERTIREAVDKWDEAAKLHQSLTFEQCHPKLELTGKE